MNSPIAQAQDALRRALASPPEERGPYLKAAGRFADAALENEKSLEALAVAASTSVMHRKYPEAQRYVDQMHEYGAEREAFALVFEAADRMLNERPNDHPARLADGVLRWAMLWEESDALARLENVDPRKLKPDEVEILLNMRSVMLYGVGKYQEAADGCTLHLEAIIEHHCNRKSLAMVHSNRACALERVDRYCAYREALQDYARSHALSPEPNLLMARAGIYHSLYEPRQGIEEYEKAVVAGAQDTRENLVLHANLLAGTGRRVQAGHALERARKHQREGAKILVSEAKALTLLKRYDEAIAILQPFVDERPQHHGAFAHLGYCHRMTGSGEQAREAYGRALAIVEGMPAADRTMSAWISGVRAQAGLRKIDGRGSRQLALDAFERWALPRYIIDHVRVLS